MRLSKEKENHQPRADASYHDQKHVGRRSPAAQHTKRYGMLRYGMVRYGIAGKKLTASIVKSRSQG